MPILRTGLQRHPLSGAYYFLRRIPTDDLVCYLGKKEITFSLLTKDYCTVFERYRAEEVRLTSEWKDERHRQAERYARTRLAAITHIDVLTTEAIDAICLHVESTSLAGDEVCRENGHYTLGDVEEYQTGYTEANRILKVAVDIGDYELLRGPLEQFLRMYR